MKKQNIIIKGGELQNKQDMRAVQELQEGLDKIERFPVFTPDLQWFENIVVTEKEKSRKKLIKELSLFIMIAFIILSIIIVSLYQMPVIFLILQIFSTVFIVFYTGAGLKKKVESS
nr:YxlC family protein [Neobacillus sp. Marseille-Q6967]